MKPPKARPVRCNCTRDSQGSAHLDAGLSAASVSQSNIPELRNDEQMRVQAAMANARDQYVDLFEFVPVGYLTLNIKGCIDKINLAGAALLGDESNKFVNQPFSNFVSSEDADLWRQYFKHARQSDPQRSCELALKRIDGTVFHARLDYRNAEIGGASAICLVLADITEEKRREKETMEWRNEMAELKKMQIAAQTAAAIAHELNQPLLAIASYSEAALKLVKAKKPELEKISKAIAGCERQAQRAGKTIHELLDFLSLKEIPVEAFDLNKVIGNVVNTARLEHELQFDSVLLLEDKLPLVFANRTHVEKILFNLLRNGIEAMQEAGVPLPAITVTVCTKIGANAAQVTIQDNGPGVKEENLHLLFKPFFTTKPTGIGMGLAVSRSLIEANGGQLWIDPTEDSGATFHLTLPFAS
ncbi:MAG: PAS domain-containing sensor histidine kinase [Sideroxyarcus sp.]